MPRQEAQQNLEWDLSRRMKDLLGGFLSVCWWMIPSHHFPPHPERGTYPGAQLWPVGQCIPHASSAQPWKWHTFNLVVSDRESRGSRIQTLLLSFSFHRWDNFQALRERWETSSFWMAPSILDLDRGYLNREKEDGLCWVATWEIWVLVSACLQTSQVTFDPLPLNEVRHQVTRWLLISYSYLCASVSLWQTGISLGCKNNATSGRDARDL